MIDLSAITLNPKEEVDFQKFVIEKSFENLTIKGLISIETGVKMKQQIIFVSRMSKTGIKDVNCTAPASGAEVVFSQKYWEPESVGDRLDLCQKTVNSLFKAYFDKISKYSETFDPSNSDEIKLLTVLLIEAMSEALERLIWLGDKAVVQAGAAQEGVVLAADVKFYDPCNGLWARIFAGVTANDIKRVTITQNALLTTALQLTLAAGAARAYFELVWAKADPRLKADPTKKLYVNNALYENYRQDLQAKGENSSIVPTQDGFQKLMWNGVEVINMEIAWDLRLFADFVTDTTDNTYFLPNRIILSTPGNLAAATLNETDFSTIDAFYDKKDKKYYIDYGFTLDTQYKEGYMIVVAY